MCHYKGGKGDEFVRGYTEGTSRMEGKAVFLYLSSGFKCMPDNNSILLNYLPTILGHICVFCGFLNFHFIIQRF